MLFNFKYKIFQSSAYYVHLAQVMIQQAIYPQCSRCQLQSVLMNGLIWAVFYTFICKEENEIIYIIGEWVKLVKSLPTSIYIEYNLLLCYFKYLNYFYFLTRINTLSIKKWILCVCGSPQSVLIMICYPS